MTLGDERRGRSVVKLALGLGLGSFLADPAAAAPPPPPPQEDCEYTLEELDIALQNGEQKVEIRLDEQGKVSSSTTEVDISVSACRKPDVVSKSTTETTALDADGNEIDPKDEEKPENDRKSYALTDQVPKRSKATTIIINNKTTNIEVTEVDLDVDVSVRNGRGCPTCMPRYPKRRPQHYLLAPYDIPASAGGMGLEPVEISDPGDSTVTRGRGSVPIGVGAEAGVGFGLTFGFRPFRAFDGAGKRAERVAADGARPADVSGASQAPDDQPAATPGPSSGAPQTSVYQLGTAGWSGASLPLSAWAPSPEAAEPERQPESYGAPTDEGDGSSPKRSWIFRAADTIELSFAVSPQRQLQPIDVGVVAANFPPDIGLSNRYAIGLSIDLFEQGSRKTVDTDQGYAQPDRWEREENKRGRLRRLKEYRPGSGRRAIDACIETFNNAPADSWDEILLDSVEGLGSDQQSALGFVRDALRGRRFEEVQDAVDGALEQLQGDELGERAKTIAREKLAQLSELAHQASRAVLDERQDWLDMQECGSRDSRTFFGLNSVVQLQNINTQFSMPLWRTNLVFKVNFGRKQQNDGDFRWTKRRSAYANRLTPGWLGSVSLQGGLDVHGAPDDVAGMDTMRILPRVTGGGDLRVAVGGRFVRGRLEGGLRGAVRGADEYWNYWGAGAGLDIILPHDFTLSPGVRFSAYNHVTMFEEVDTVNKRAS